MDWPGEVAGVSWELLLLFSWRRLSSADLLLFWSFFSTPQCSCSWAATADLLVFLFHPSVAVSGLLHHRSLSSVELQLLICYCSDVSFQCSCSCAATPSTGCWDPHFRLHITHGKAGHHFNIGFNFHYSLLDSLVHLFCLLFFGGLD